MRRTRTVPHDHQLLIAVVCFILGILCLVLVLTGTASAQSIGAQRALILGNVADMVSTEIALHRPSVRETNPLLGQSSVQRVIVKSAGTVAQVWVLRTLGRRHPKTATVVGYTLGAVLTGVAVRNLRVGVQR